MSGSSTHEIEKPPKHEETCQKTDHPGLWLIEWIVAVKALPEPDDETIGFRWFHGFEAFALLGCIMPIGRDFPGVRGGKHRHVISRAAIGVGPECALRCWVEVPENDQDRAEEAEI